jgi:hypothetical protein
MSIGRAVFGLVTVVTDEVEEGEGTSIFDVAVDDVSSAILSALL